MKSQEPLYSVSQLDLSVSDALLLKYRSQDRRRGTILSILEEDWPCARLLLNRLMGVTSSLGKASDQILVRILDRSLERYESTVTQGPIGPIEVLRYVDGYRYAVFVDAVLTEACLEFDCSGRPSLVEVLSQFGSHTADDAPETFCAREALYRHLVPEGMRQYFKELNYENGVVGHCLDTGDRDLAGVHARPQSVD